MNKCYLTLSLLASCSFVHGMETKTVAKPTDWDAKKYNENSSPQQTAAMKVLSHIVFDERMMLLILVVVMEK